MDVVRTVSTSGNTNSDNNNNNVIFDAEGSPRSSDARMRLKDRSSTSAATNTSATVAQNERERHHALISDDSGPTRIPMETTSNNASSVNTSLLSNTTDPMSSKAAAVQDDDDEEDELDREGDRADRDEDDEEDDYEYEYEDEDEAAFGGFLQVSNPPPPSAAPASTTSSAEVMHNATNSKPAKIEEDIVVEPTRPRNTAAVSKRSMDLDDGAPVASSSESVNKKPLWKEPSREAVNMSLRAEKETSGSKRRLAQDLYRIMNKDTEETGFSLQPSKEDCMDKWTIKLFQFDPDSHLAKDMLVLGIDSIEMEMSFPDQYPFEPPFVRVVQPRFKRQTGFVMNGAICMELLTKDGWNPVNDIESVIVSVRSLLVVGEGRLEAAFNLPEAKYNTLLETAESVKREQDALEQGAEDDDSQQAVKRQRKNSHGESQALLSEQQRRVLRAEKNGGKYSEADAKAAYEHLSSYHKKKGWDNSGWWARKG